MSIPKLQSRRLFLMPLSISELTQINNNELDQMEIQFDSEIISDSFRAAITKKD